MPLSASPLISVLILNWNGAACLPRCLEAIANQTFDNYEVIVIDNASTDHSADQLETYWSTLCMNQSVHFCVLRLPGNLGFAAANNLGANHAQGLWLAVLNNDAFPEPVWLESLANAAYSHPEYSFFSAHILQAKDPEKIDGTGDICHISGLAWHRDLNQPRTIQRPRSEVFSPNAAAAMYRKDIFLQAGGFDEDYTSHHEDVDLGFRLRLQGQRCLYVPEAVVYHMGSASYGIESDRTVYQTHRNFVWTYFKDMPGLLVWKYLPAHLFANLFFIFHYTTRKQGKVIWRAKIDALRGLPAVLRKRRILQAQRTVPPAAISRLLDHGFAAPYLLGTRGKALRQLTERLKRGQPPRQ